VGFGFCGSRGFLRYDQRQLALRGQFGARRGRQQRQSRNHCHFPSHQSISSLINAVRAAAYSMRSVTKKVLEARSKAGSTAPKRSRAVNAAPVGVVVVRRNGIIPASVD